MRSALIHSLPGCLCPLLLPALSRSLTGFVSFVKRPETDALLAAYHKNCAERGEEGDEEAELSRLFAEHKAAEAKRAAKRQAELEKVRAAQADALRKTKEAEEVARRQLMDEASKRKVCHTPTPLTLQPAAAAAAAAAAAGPSAAEVRATRARGCGSIVVGCGWLTCLRELTISHSHCGASRR
jgi:hypothetical protein